ncbi:MAG: ethanolamine utilization protein EutH [Bacillota bacterium]
MNINKLIIYIMVFFMAVGALDKIFGNKRGYGKEFDEGFMSMGPLAIALVGILSLAPVLTSVLKPLIAPAYALFGADPAMFASTILAYDMGGYDLAMAMTSSPAIGTFSGLLHGSMMGVTIAFTIPFSLRMVDRADYPSLAKGILSGIVTIPIGCLVGGLIAGYDLGMLLRNLTPTLLVALLISVGLARIPDRMIKGFTILGHGVTIVTTIGAAAAIIEALTGFVVIKGMNPASDAVKTVGVIAMMLAGALPMVHFIKRTLGKHLERAGALIGINPTAAMGLVLTLTNSVPMFMKVKEMDARGKVVNMAFAVSASFMLAGNLGFVARANENMIVPVVLGKLAGGLSAIFVALYFANKASATAHKSSLPQPFETSRTAN